MKKEQIESIIEKFKRKSSQYRRYTEDKCAYFEQVADQIEDNLFIYLDDCFETEEDILDDVKETFAEFDDFYDDEDLRNNLF